MKFTLISPTGSQVLEINWLEVETATGNFVIQPGHAPLIAPLAPNKEIQLSLEDGSTTIMTLAGGILEVNRDDITLLAYS
ncbi:F0F1 ATP synthase subunit epsilon [Candidatus Dependentiae bacterium]|nr:F0F1 ATP synthase subunit epsilon [Candidatus Dependentiae bacterium]